MSSKSLKTILIIAGVVVLAGAGFFYFQKNKPPAAPEIEEEFPYLIDFSAAENIQETQLNILKRDYQSTIEEYKNNPKSFSALMTFAFIYYQLGDYGAARDIYIKVGENSPKNFTSFWNLGNTYLKLKDYPRAESAYLKTIENGPKETRHYVALAELYWYHLAEKKSQIPDLYKKGLQELPEDYDLLVNLAAYYKEIGDKKNALKYYQEIINNYPDMEEVIRAEMEKF